MLASSRSNSGRISHTGVFHELFVLDEPGNSSNDERFCNGTDAVDGVGSGG